jgi:hypothetical protein
MGNEMKKEEMELVKNTYCDECGRNAHKVGNIAYGKGGKDYCANHKPWSMKDIIRDYAIGEIRRQSFYA